MITLESGGMSRSKKIAYSISKIPIPQNERKQTGHERFCYTHHCGVIKMPINKWNQQEVCLEGICNYF